MARAKVTFRHRGRISTQPHASQRGRWGSEYAKSGDETLPTDLQDIVRRWRALCDTDAVPSAQARRETLARLAVVADGDAHRAVRAIDSLTKAELVSAALRLFRSEHPELASVPNQVLHNERYWSPEQIRTFAALALKFMRQSRGGRPATQTRHADYARVLLAYWERTKATQPTLRRDFETPFSRFAGKMFRRIGYGLSHRQLYRILLTAKGSTLG